MNKTLFEESQKFLPNSKYSVKFECCSSDSLTIYTYIKSPDNILTATEHAHDDYEFLMPLTPIPYLTNDDAVYFGEVGWVYPVLSGRKHGIKYDIGDVAHNSIVVKKTYFENLLNEKNRFGAQFNYEFKATDELKIYIEAFKKEFRKSDKAYKHKLEHLSALICDEFIDEATACDIDNRREKSKYQRGMRSAAEFLNDNYNKTISFCETARTFGMSPNYFSYCFKKAFGETPFVYLTKLRISKAKILLDTTDKPISEIASICGITKLSTFSEAFKKATGAYPSQYRKLGEIISLDLFE